VRLVTWLAKKSIRRVLCLSLVVSLSVGAGVAHAAESDGSERAAQAIYKEVVGIDQSVHRTVRQTEGAERVSTTLDQLMSKYDLTPRSHDCPVFFAQATVQSQFSGSGIFQKASISDVAAMLKSGKITPDAVPVSFIWLDGKRVTVNNRSLTALYKAGLRPVKLIDQSGKLRLQGSESLESVLRRIDGMAGKPSTEMLVRVAGRDNEGTLREAIDWRAPIGEIVSMPDALLAHARVCDKSPGK
jgi:hypothetical protein